VRVVSDRQRAAEATRSSRATGAELVVRSPMPGRVVKVLVDAGETVDVGRPLMVIEAMKMEMSSAPNAPASSAAVHVRAGDAVEANAKLVTLS
jgi:biotin carboxyl carrier protein